MRIFLFILAIFQCTALASSLSNNVKQIVQRCTLAIVSTNQNSIEESLFYTKDLSKNIENNKTYGTGFVYHNKKYEDPIILTNFHVVKQPLREKLNIFGCNAEKCLPLYVKMIDKESDIAMLSTKESFNCENALSLKDDGVTSPVSIFIYGNKFGLNNSFAFGSLAANNIKIEANKTVHLLDVNAGEGNSGGPIFLNNSTNIIGMLKSVYLMENSSIAIGIRVQDIVYSIAKMEHILNFQKYLEYQVVEDGGQVYFIRNSDEDIFFDNFNLSPKDKIQNIDDKNITNALEALYYTYEFLNNPNKKNIRITFITEVGALESKVFTKYGGNTEGAVVSKATE